MSIAIPLRLLLKTSIACVALALPIAAWGQSLPSQSAKPLANDKKTHTITISYANGAWSYSIYPAQPNPKKAKVKRGDTLNWVCADGSWTVFFKNGITPLVDENGNPVATVDGASGAADGASVGAKPKDNDSYLYGVRVNLNGGGGPVVDDPEIIIES